MVAVSTHDLFSDDSVSSLSSSRLDSRHSRGSSRRVGAVAGKGRPPSLQPYSKGTSEGPDTGYVAFHSAQVGLVRASLHCGTPGALPKPLDQAGISCLSFLFSSLPAHLRYGAHGLLRFGQASGMEAAGNMAAVLLDHSPISVVK